MAFKGAKFIDQHLRCLEACAPYIGNAALDFGCGNGFITNQLATASPKSTIHGYDGPETGAHFSEQLLDLARERYVKRQNVRILPGKPFLNTYDTVILMCVLHSDETLIEHSLRYLRKGGNMLVFDHDKSHLSMDRFMDYVTDADEKEINRRGFEATYKDHTRMTLERCMMLGSRFTLETEFGLDHSSSLMAGYPFYIWSGRSR